MQILEFLRIVIYVYVIRGKFSIVEQFYIHVTFLVRIHMNVNHVNLLNNYELSKFLNVPSYVLHGKFMTYQPTDQLT